MYKIRYPEDLIGNLSPILKEAVQEDYNRDLEWLWVADEVPSTLEREYCLRRALYINPSNRKTQHSLNEIVKNRFPKKKHTYTISRFLKCLMSRVDIVCKWMKLSNRSEVKDIMHHYHVGQIEIDSTNN